MYIFKQFIIELKINVCIKATKTLHFVARQRYYLLRQFVNKLFIINSYKLNQTHHALSFFISTLNTDRAFYKLVCFVKIS